MSSTRRANKRARIRRRAENDAMRDARREALFIILSRAQRGRPLTADEAAQLRVAVEAEIREGDTARLSERGQQRAMEEHRQRVEAADEAIRELEQRAEQAEAEVEGYRAAEKYRQAAADTLAGRLDAIRQQTAEGLVEGFEELTKRAEQAERQRDDLAAELKQRTEADSADAAAGSYAARAEAAEARLDEQRQALAAALHANDVHEWPALIDWAAQAHEWATRAAVKADRKRIEELEHERAVIAAALHAERARLTEQQRRADYRGAQLADALHRADTYRAAWHSARDRARKATRRGDIWRAKAYEIEQDRDRLAAALPLTAVPARRPEVITNRATIRNTLDELAPAEEPKPARRKCTCDNCQPPRP